MSVGTRIAGRIARIGLLAVAFFLGGYAAFALHLPRTAPAAAPEGDGIVALTGGAERLSAAITLLEAKRAQRLLISGVNAQTSETALAAQHGRSPELFSCCIDTGREAADTIGNAREIALWAREHGFRRLIVVTAAYHMPRATLELARAYPAIEIIAYPVHPRPIDLDAWWYDPVTIRVLMSEYVKYLVALARPGVERYA